MERPATIREILGFTQQELALVLNVDRTQIAKYELGKRDLPIAARYLLAELLQVAQSQELSAKPLPEIERQASRKQQLLEKMLKESVYQLELLVRKMTTLERKHEANIKALRLVDHLTNQMADRHPAQTAAINAIGKKAAQRLESDDANTLFQYKLRYELLVSENMLLQAELRKLHQRTAVQEGE